MCYNLNYKFKRGDIVSKVNAKITLQNAEDNFEYVVPAIYHDDEKVIIYNEQDDQKTLVKFNYITKELIRENDSLLMKYNFNKEKNSQGTIYVKGMEKNLIVTIKTLKLVRWEDNNIEIEYQIENDKFNYKIEVI